MIGRFRGREVMWQTALLTSAGALIGVSWTLHWLGVYPRIETVASLIATVFCGGPIILGAARGLLSKQMNVDELVSLAILASVIAGEYLTAATVGFIMVLGSLLESFTSAKAQKAIESLVDLSPETARIIEGDIERIVPIGNVTPGQTALVKPGEKVPVDGVVLEGSASVDQAALTGEPIPIEASVGSEVFAGSFVHGGALTLEVTRVGEDSTLGKIVSLVREAEKHQARIVRSADSFAKWFTPGILTLAGIVWLLSGDFLRCVSVLVVGCPCALILATPTAVVAAMGAAAKRGLMIKGGKFLEALADVDTVVFDKTGTLTIGSPTVQEVSSYNGATQKEVLSWAASVEQKSEHPFARAIIHEAKRQNVRIQHAEDFESDTGLGVTGLVQASKVRVGRNTYIQHSVEPAQQENGNTPLWVERDNVCVGVILLGDEVRPAAKTAIQDLKRIGIDSIHLLSGDQSNPVGRLAANIGIDSWRGELLPHEKVEFIKRLQGQNRTVMYVGDGVNDGPALATSHVGVAMGSGASPLALETSSIAILSGDVDQVPALVRLGRVTKRRILENLIVFALLFNGIAILLASVGVLAPIMGAIVHNLGSVAVVVNSARLVRWRP